MIVLKESMSGFKDGETWTGSAGEKVTHFDAETEQRLIDAGIAEKPKTVKKAAKKK